MRKILSATLALLVLCGMRSHACTNIIVTPGASADGSCMVSYAADSHVLYGELYFHKAASYRPGTMMDVIEWDSYRPLGSIPQASRTFQSVGNMNEHQLIIAETTWGGREEQMDTTGIMDYGTLIYTALQRASSAREAIALIVNLANEYGYPSEGETFSIADPQEAWVMDIVGKGSPAPGEKHPGIAWVARRVPDGYICAHANQSRITRFPFDDPQNCLYDPDVVEYARRMGWFSGEDSEFSFRDAFNPLDFGGARACDARAWAAFNRLCDGSFTYFEAEAFGGAHDGSAAELTRPATDYLDYAMGYDLGGEMPLFVKPSRKLSVKDVADAMRDHFEDTPMDMRWDVGAGGNECPYRWRPMSFEWEGCTYVNERAIATQQTGFWFVGQARATLPDLVGALLWFGCDDAATSYLTPIYVNLSEVPECLRVGNGDMLHYSPTSQFWMCNRVTNACYRMYNQMAPLVRERVDAFENGMIFSAVPEMDKELLSIYNGRHSRHPGRRSAVRRAVRRMTRFSVGTAMKQLSEWTALEEMLTVKFIDGNVKAQNEDGSFKHTPYHDGTPEGLQQPGYSDRWKAALARDNGEILRQPQ